MSPDPTRRQVLIGGGAFLLSLTVPIVSRAGSALAQPTQRGVEGYIRLAADGRVTVFTGKVEIGQGIKTSLSQIVAEELGLPLQSIDLITADTERTPNEGYTAGSMSVERSGKALREAAAQVRQIVLETAAQNLDSDVASMVIETRSGEALVHSTSNGRTISIAELAKGDPTAQAPRGAFTTKNPESYELVGVSAPRVDLPAKVFGLPAFVHDLRLPGMLHARVLRPPRYGSRLVALDTEAVSAMPGVVAVHRDGSFLAVITVREEQAVDAAARLRDKAEWSRGTSPTFDRKTSVSDWFESFDAQSAVVHTTPALETAPEIEARHAARYSKPFLAHGSIGPSCAVARLDDGMLTVWSHTQGPFPLRSALARVLDREEESLRVVHMEGSGCYGHNGADDVALDAALLARTVPGKPVRVQWSREDEHCWEPFGTAMLLELEAALDKEGKVCEWRYELWSHPHSTRPGRRSTLLAGRHLERPVPAPPPFNIPLPSGGGARNALPLYDFPAQTITENFVAEMPVRVSALRSLGAFANIFAIESFVDELAVLAESDPIEFRLRHSSDERARAVLERLRELTAERERSDGTGFGIAFAQYKNQSAYCAVAVEAQVDEAVGRVSLPRVVAVADAGLIVNPDGARNQIEGGIVQGASWTLYECVTMGREGVTSRDWSDYEILRFAEAPEVVVELIDRPGEAPLGIGEAAQGPVAAAIANAVFDAVGARVRDLPITPQRVLESLAAADV